MDRRLRDSQRAADVFAGPGGACRPIGKVVKGIVQPLGSCVLFEVQGELFLATASHVLSESNVGGERVAVLTGNGRFAAGVNGTAMGTTPTNGMDRLDFFVLHCDPETRNALTGTPRLTATQLAIEHDATREPNDTYLIEGYPLSKVSRPKPKHRTYSPFLLTTFAAPVRVYKALGVHEPTHLVVAHDVRNSRNLSEHRAPSVKGVSGGAVWTLGADPDAPGDTARLVGIAIEYHSRQNAIIAVRIGVLTEFMRVNAPHLVKIASNSAVHTDN